MRGGSENARCSMVCLDRAHGRSLGSLAVLPGFSSRSLRAMARHSPQRSAACCPKDPGNGTRYCESHRFSTSNPSETTPRMDTSVSDNATVPFFINIKKIPQDLPWLIRMRYANNISAIDLESTMPGHVDIPRLRQGKVGGFFWLGFPILLFKNVKLNS